jgi:Uma2 family endonuclease
MATAPAQAKVSEFPQPMNGSRTGEPVWDVALWYPPQGYWSEADYVSLCPDWLVEFNNGIVEFLPMPTFLHQLIIDYLHEMLKAFLKGKGLGRALQGPLRVRVGERLVRLPDIAYFRHERIPVNRRQMPNGADLAMEVVSEDDENRERDYVMKRAEYAMAGIGEYWIVDPQEQRITVLTLDGGGYRVHGEFVPGQQASSVMFPAFAVDVAAAFAAREGPATA